MKVQYTFITRTFRGMVLVSRSTPALSKSLGQTQPITFYTTSAFGPIDPNIYAHSTISWKWGKQDLKSVVDRGSEYNNIVWERDFRETVPSVNDKRVIERSRENGHDESSAFRKFSRPRPRPQRVPWQSEIENTVHFIGVIVSAPRFHFTEPTYGYAWSVLEVKNSHEDVPIVNNGHKDEPLRFDLMFWGRLAEDAVKNLNKNDRVYVSGCLTSETVAENDKPCISYKVIVKTLSLAPEICPGSSQPRVVSTDVPYLSVSKQVVVSENTVRNGVTSFQYQQSRFVSSNSGNKTGETAATVEGLWLAFFTNPDDWWDNRERKVNNSVASCLTMVSQNHPDFTHKVTNKELWISSSPSWVKSKLALRDSRMKDPEEWRGD